MITSRRDYILRIIDEVGRLLARVVFKRRAGSDQEALESVVEGCERLFGREAQQIFQLTPEQHFALLIENEEPLIARDKVLLYAALCAEAGRIYSRLGKPALAHASFTNALRLAVKARVLKLTDGKFRNRGPMEHNLPVDLGKTALLEVKGIQVIITERCQTPNDPGYFALHGIDLDKVALLCVKAKNHFRAGFTPLTRAIIDVDCPGPAASNLRHYRFRHAPMSLYPLNQ